MSVGTDATKSLRGVVDRAQQQSRAWQADQLRRTGYATPHPELGHAVTFALREAGYSVTFAHIGGQLAAVSTAYNWQGCARIAAIVGRHKRTVQRARARLEADGLLRSELLLTGDMIDGQRSPVRHPQVVRDVSALQRLARARAAARSTQPARRGKRRPSAAHAPQPSPAPAPMTAAELRALGEAHPEFAAFFGEMAAAAAKRQPPPPAAAKIEPGEIDAAERDIAERERQLKLERERVRGPPRGPPR
ncbi:MAG TPA: hypothetical protein VLB72_10020 [Burkholderiales bacterium]|nr:hypothetical protein [Burkholderiales bacterium]